MRRVRPVSRSITSMSRKAARISVPETAATRTSSVLSIMPHIRMGNMSVRAEERKRETGTLSTEATKARKAPAAMPGAISGRVTRRKVWRQQRRAGRGRGGDRQGRAVRQVDRGHAVRHALHRAGQPVDGADEVGDEEGLWPVIDLDRRAKLLDMA